MEEYGSNDTGFKGNAKYMFITNDFGFRIPRKQA